MIRLGKDYLLMIEPNREGPPTEPINDELTDKIKYIYERTVMPPLGQRYKGFHDFKTKVCIEDGHEIEYVVNSDNSDHYLPNGVITNSLCVYYVQCFRQHIPASEIDKINRLYEMCKAKPNRLFNQRWERSKLKETNLIRRDITKSKQEFEERMEKRKIEQEENKKIEDKAYEEAKAKDKRSTFWKDAMERAGVHVKYK